jgi:hypothetical protein
MKKPISIKGIPKVTVIGQEKIINYTTNEIRKVWNVKTVVRKNQSFTDAPSAFQRSRRLRPWAFRPWPSASGRAVVASPAQAPRLPEASPAADIKSNKFPMYNSDACP